MCGDKLSFSDIDSAVCPSADLRNISSSLLVSLVSGVMNKLGALFLVLLMRTPNKAYV